MCPLFLSRFIPARRFPLVTHASADFFALYFASKTKCALQLGRGWLADGSVGETACGRSLATLDGCRHKHKSRKEKQKSIYKCYGKANNNKPTRRAINLRLLF